MGEPPAILVEGLVKVYGKTRAVDGLDLEVAKGSLVAVLGPNGAGKTTLIRILATLAKPSGGRAMVAGCDVASHPAQVRRSIGIAGQSESIDEYLTGRQNLVMVGELSRLPGSEAKHRATNLLVRFELTEAADRPTKTYSGGMRRKLDLAASMITQPEVLFLDEPTTGLDPRARMGMWQLIRELGEAGTTILLTTQYLDEADQLAHNIAVVDSGKVIAWGSPNQLKTQVGGAVLEVTLPESADLEEAAALLRRDLSKSVTVDQRRYKLTLPSTEQTGLATRVIRTLDAGGVLVDDVTVRRPALDDVFMTLTGHGAEEAGEDAA
ncbi:MAG TPA: ATP-binding cassette domain-containing protein [Candidatus Dormibacteraeota bacterium]|nr:ATP-binding cassette domain-containing protein [Candidatus Dormibacteraeota bacterium]